MTNKIEEIRERHTRDERWRYSPSMICPQMHDDRAILLAEVDRLRADLATQQGCCDGAAAQDAHIRQEREEHRAEAEKLRAEIERLREALKPFAALFLWPDDADDEWNDIQPDEDWRYLKKNDAAINEKWVRRGDIRAARKALEGKP